MKDVNKTPYAKWLEGLIRNVVEEKPTQIAVVMMMDDGTAATGYYGERTPEDIAKMAWHLQMDAVWEMVSVNADKLLIMGQELLEAEDEEEEAEEGEDGDDDPE